MATTTYVTAPAMNAWGRIYRILDGVKPLTEEQKNKVPYTPLLLFGEIYEDRKPLLTEELASRVTELLQQIPREFPANHLPESKIAAFWTGFYQQRPDAKMGRPKIYDEDELVSRNFRLPKTIYDKVKEKADSLHLKVSDVIRGLLEDWLEKN